MTMTYLPKCKEYNSFNTYEFRNWVVRLEVVLHGVVEDGEDVEGVGDGQVDQHGDVQVAVSGGEIRFVIATSQV